MPFSEVEGLLRSTVGLLHTSTGSSALETTVRNRMLACKVDHVRDYLALLRNTPGELDQLVDQIVVCETWFFREPPAFELLCQRCALNSAQRDQPYRVLSIGCATGEEPYSIAMSLLGAGIRPAGFEVHAVDVSARALDVARRGMYGRTSFRAPCGRNGQFFDASSAGMRVNERVRAQVSFSQGNVLDPRLCAGTQFEAVFCRNLLSYLDPASRLVALGNLDRLLRPDGVLFAGQSESPEVAAFGFRALGQARGFAFTQRRVDSKRPDKARVRLARVRNLRRVTPAGR